MKKNQQPAFKRKNFGITRENLLMEFFALLVAATAVHVFYFLDYLPQMKVNELARQRAAFLSAPVNLPETWLSFYFTEEEILANQIIGRDIDADGDGLSNYQEYVYGLNPKDADTYKEGKGDAFYVENNLTGPGVSGTETLGLTPLANLSRTFKDAGEELATNDMVDAELMDQTFQLSRSYTRPTVPNSALHLVAQSRKAEENYTSNFNALITGERTQSIYGEFDVLFTHTEAPQLETIKSSLDFVLNTLYNLPVPPSMAEHLKRQIIFFNALKSIVLAQEKILNNPDDYSQWGEILYQSRVISDIGGVAWEGE